MRYCPVGQASVLPASISIDSLWLRCFDLEMLQPGFLPQETFMEHC